MSAVDDDEEDSFSSDSDDEFLTLGRQGLSEAGGSGGGAGGVDREALIRKKLLESFYGKAAVATDPTLVDGLGKPTPNSNDRWSADNDDHSDSHSESDSEDSDEDPIKAEDLDAPQFNAVAHTQKHVFSSGVHPLLETEESLACQVRTLDSSLQTLVYENYSRFIEATDAIRNIGVNVQANEANLATLSESMQKVSGASRSVETAVGPLRDQVVEKLRVKRLLKRLDTLLKLPATLRQQIQAGKYRWAAQSYLSAYAILSKHSQGFESLQRIEAECRDILHELLQDVRRKLVHWSGGLVRFGSADHGYDTSTNSEEDGEATSPSTSHPDDPDQNPDEDQGQDEDLPLPDPPKSIAEILECAGTSALILYQQQQQQQSQQPSKEGLANEEEEEESAEPDSGILLFRPNLTIPECQEMALAASLRFLERILDTHHIERSDQQMLLRGNSHPSSSSASTVGLIPTMVLDNILEASTLYSMSFSHHHTNHHDDPNMDNEKDDYDYEPSRTGESHQDERLSQFVSTAFNNFLQHVRGELLEQTMRFQQQQQQQQQQQAATHDPESPVKDPTSMTEGNLDVEQDEDRAYEQIAGAMNTLLGSVRELASGLALPEVAVSAELASSLVDQTVGLTEAMVRRRVDQKFYSLRLRVVVDCLAPFCEAVAALSDEQKEEDEDLSKLLEAVQLASVALSDSLQLVDDTVRSILAKAEDEEAATGKLSTSETSEDDTMLKEAVEQSTKRFARWLATAMEMLAGMESSDPRLLLQVSKTLPGETADEEGGYPGGDSPSKALSGTHFIADDASEMSAEPADGLVKTAWLRLLDSLRPTSDMALAIAEMCRVAERSVVENINQSIATHTGGHKQRKTSAIGGGLFSDDKDSTANPTSERFHLAASRVLSLYAMNRGDEAAQALCSDLLNISSREEDVESPSLAVGRVLEIAKAASLDCANLFGGTKRAGPIPETLEDEYASLTSNLSRQSMNRSGLIFDVERMFVEKVVVYPHPNDVLDFQRNLVLAMVLRVAFKTLCESTRLVRFSLAGFRQLMVDVEFLRWYLPHYIKDETLPDGSQARGALETLLTEAIQTAKDRCPDRAELGEENDEKNHARATIRIFMSSIQGAGEASEGLNPRRFVLTED